ncbi:MAG TPA: substrate-binding domain-containing protein [Candidatus Aquilonibacter sp.]
MMKSTACRVVVLVALMSLSACAGSSTRSMDITIAGSTALLPLVKQAALDYEGAHLDARISVSGGGSGVGITQAAEKGVDIGNSDISAPGEPSLVDHRVAVVMFAVIVNGAAGVRNLSRAQIRDVFTGKITNWKDVGGVDQRISVINRPRSSGTRAVFVQEILGGVQPLAAGMTEDSSGTVAVQVAQTPGTASYIATSYVRDPAIAKISIDGVEPTTPNVLSGTYRFWSYEHMFTMGKPRKNVAAFIDYVANDTAALEALGFIPVSKMKGVR